MFNYMSVCMWCGWEVCLSQLPLRKMLYPLYQELQRLQAPYEC